MEITGKVHLMFEQSGTFKKEFIKLGYPAEDYDIQNNFGETNHVVDLFKAIEDAYGDLPSVFDDITPDDLIFAFFPCIYFTGSTNPCYYTLENYNYKSLTLSEKLYLRFHFGQETRTYDSNFILILWKKFGKTLKALKECIKLATLEELKVS
jgi:hypothetical protein